MKGSEPSDDILRVLDLHPVATAIFDTKGCALYANSAARELFDDGPHGAADLTKWKVQRRTLEATLALAAASSSWLPVRFFREAREVHAQARGVMLTPGQPARVMVTVAADAAEPFLRQAENLNRLNEELAVRQRAEARLAFALKAAKIGIWEYDVLTDTTWRSDRHDEIFGYATQLPEWTLPRFLTHVVEGEKQRVQDLIEGSITRKQPYRLECEIIRTDGERRWIAAEGAPTLGPDGEVALINGVVFDVTDVREAEMRMETAQRMESLGQMAGGLAHDFSNIIGIVRLQAEVASLTRDTDTVWDRLDAILQAAGRGAELAARTLSFARREPGIAEAVALRPMAEEVVELTFGEAIGTIAVDLSGIQDVSVKADPGQLENALLNLFLNARDAINASGVGSRITMIAARSSVTGMIDISVSDDGPGMPENVRNRAADPFFTTKEGTGGTGLGLSTVAAFCASADGGFELRSSPGEGTIVTLVLPEAELDTMEPAADAPDGPNATEQSMRLLIVEDQAGFRDALALLLTAMGHSVEVFAEATSALEAIEGGIEIDVLLTDILLPGNMNGFDLAREVIEMRPDIGLIYISGYADESGRARAPGGIFLRKPVEREDLAKALDHWWRRRSSKRSEVS